MVSNMTRHKYTTPACLAIVLVMLATAVLFVFSESFGLQVAAAQQPYIETLFSTDTVHTLDIVVEQSEWQAMLDSAVEKEYIPCTVVIDGEKVSYVGIRAKGNSSLSSVAGSDSDRYSFKIEFDHYNSGQTYRGLDKLALNNIVQDNTYLKDYVCYQMMNAFDADAPLASFISITVNGQDWGLYLAVEGIEQAFAQRSYGSDYGQLYKPDSMDMLDGGGMGGAGGAPPARPPREEAQQTGQQTTQQEAPGPAPEEAIQGEDTGGEQQRRGPGGGLGGQQSSDVALLYTDDAHDSYAHIFDNAVFDPTDADKDRLIAAIRQLNEGEDIRQAVDVEEVLRYFVVHNFVLNFDSYTGSMLHNYYLYEKEGVLSMVAWDYNLAFGGMSGRGNRGGAQTESSIDTATAMVNYPIDTPLSGAQLEERPMLGRLLADEEYLAQYHQLFSEFMQSYFASGAFSAMIDNATALIAPYVEADPTAFCTYDEFLTASSTLKDFCLLRAESVTGQLAGSIPATEQGQAEQPDALLDASHLAYDSMGSNNFGRGGGMPGQPNEQQTANAAATAPDPADAENGQQEPPDGRMPGAQSEGAAGGASNNDLVILLAVSLALLAGGLLFAKRFRR